MTEQQTHTPGPWHAMACDDGFWIGNDNENAAFVPGFTDHPLNQANASLVAAAPDMLATLRHVSYFLNLMSYTLECQETAEILKKDCEAAIAKAEGVAKGVSPNT